MRLLLPDVKLIYLVRNPVERALSHYHHNRFVGREHGSPEIAIQEDSPYVLTSKYGFQIEPYVDRFPRDRLLIIDTQALADSVSSTLARVARFLGAQPKFSPDVLRVRFNVASQNVGRSLRSAQQSESPRLRLRLWKLFARDIERFESLTGTEFPEWRSLPSRRHDISDWERESQGILQTPRPVLKSSRDG